MELDLSLKVGQRGIWGTAKQARLAPEHVAWFEGLFDCLVSIAECNEELPPCALRTSRRNPR